MRVNAWILSLMLSLAVATTVNAQGGGRGGGRGGGMFGGGGIFSIAGNEAAQKDIGLSNDEIAKVKVVTDEFDAARRESFTGAGNFRDMSDDERAKAMEKMADNMKALTAKFLPKLKETMTADQFTRLQQINWQNMGGTALAEPEVVKSLALVKDQQDKIKSLTTEYDGKRRELFTGGGGGDTREKMRELTKERDTKMNEVLSKEQLDKFASLKGKPFDTEQLRMGRGGGGGGGGGGGRGKRPQPKAE